MNENIKHFFNDIDQSILNTPVELAKSFLYYIMSNNLSCSNAIDSNISILSDDESLDFITKRSLLISDNLLLSNKSIKHVRIYSDHSLSDSERVTSYHTRNNNLYALGVWLKNVRSLLINGNITYIPCSYKVTFERGGLDWTFRSTKKRFNINSNLHNNIIQSKKLICSSSEITSSYLKPVLSLEIPIIDDVDLETFSNITLDNLDSAKRFQNYLKLSILDTNANDLSDRMLAKISLDIQSQLDDMQHMYQKTIDRYRLSSTISCVSTITAVLLCINANIPEVIKIVSGISSGCGLVPFLQSNIERFSLTDSLKDNKCYYLWVLQK